MSIPDHRIRFPSTRIDFDTDVGVTGQDHDSYPAPGSQARYDHQRLFLIGLLANQSSSAAPSEYREGTLWFDLNTSTLRIRSGDAWVPAAEALALTEPDTNGDVVTLASWYESLQPTLTGLAPEVVFAGHCTASTTTIPIPSGLQSSLDSSSRVFLYINGQLVSPLKVSLIGSPNPTTVKLSGVSLSASDEFVVNIRKITSPTYYTSTVVAP